MHEKPSECIQWCDSDGDFSDLQPKSATVLTELELFEKREELEEKRREKRDILQTREGLAEQQKENMSASYADLQVRTDVDDV